MSDSNSSTLSEEQQRQLISAVGVIMALSAGCRISCERQEVHRPEEVIQLLTASPFLDGPAIELILSQVEALAEVLNFSEINPPKKTLAFLAIDTSPEVAMFVDFDWRTNGSRSARVDYPKPLLPGQLLAVQGNIGRLGVGPGCGAVMTGPADDHYNCMAWTLGVTTTPVWPAPHIGAVSLAALDELYARNGVQRDFTGQISAWGRSDDLMHHVALQWIGTYWESKLGRYIRTGHSTPVKFSGSYGSILHHYRFTMGPLETARRFAAAREVQLKRFRLTEEALAKLERVAAAVAPELSRVFDDCYRRWLDQAADPNGEIARSSNPYDAVKAPEFSHLVGLGTAVAPLALLRAARGDWRANPLADQLLPELRAGRSPEYVGEDVRAREIAATGLALVA
jgi:hypothetical protein